MTVFKKGNIKYRQYRSRSIYGFSYEFWWVRWPNRNWHELMKVTIPPEDGPCSDWPLTYSAADCSPTIRDETDFSLVNWVQYVPEPNQREYS